MWFQEIVKKRQKTGYQISLEIKRDLPFFKGERQETLNWFFKAILFIRKSIPVYIETSLSSWNHSLERFSDLHWLKIIACVKSIFWSADHLNFPRNDFKTRRTGMLFLMNKIALKNKMASNQCLEWVCRILKGYLATFKMW